MAKTNTTTVQFSISGDGFSSSPLFNSQQTNPAGEPPSSVTLATGVNTIPIPADALGVVIVPPPSSVVTKTIKGASGDTGLPMAPAQPFAWAFNAGAAASFVIVAGAGEVISLFWQ